MEEVYPKLYVGDDNDCFTALSRGWAVVSACKDGPHGHRATLGYNTLAAPKGKEYLSALRGKHLVLNLIDADDPQYITDEVIDPALKFIAKHLREGDKVLVHCNQGQSRGPGVAMLFMRFIGDLPERYHTGLKIFKTIYSDYKPNQGMEHYVKSRYAKFKSPS